MSCIIFCNVLVSTNKIMDASPDKITKIKKNSYKLVISKPKNFGTVSSAGSGYKELKIPANLLAAAVDKNHTPINNEANLSGDNFTTIAKPIGDKHNSPMVCNKYKLNNHIMLTLIDGSSPFTPKTITR